MDPFAIARRINDNVYIIDLPSRIYTSSTFNVFDIYPYYPLEDTIILGDTLGTSSSKNGVKYDVWFILLEILFSLQILFSITNM